MDIRTGREGEEKKTTKCCFLGMTAIAITMHCIVFTYTSPTQNRPCQQPWMGKEFMRSDSFNAQLLAIGYS